MNEIENETTSPYSLSNCGIHMRIKSFLLKKL